MTEQTWIGVLYVVSGFVMIGLCFPLLAGRVARNRWYGFRIPKAFESEENWLLINRYGARHLLRWAAVMSGVGAYMIIAADMDETLFTWLALGAPCLLLIPVAQTLWYARRLP